MPRVRKGAARGRKHRKILKSVRGHIGAASRRYRVAREAWLRAGQHATIGRKLRKRDFRRLWITRIAAACRQRGLTYSRFMHGMAERGVALNRKMLADLAVADPGAFDAVVAVATAQAPPAAAPVSAEGSAEAEAAGEAGKSQARPVRSRPAAQEPQARVEEASPAAEGVTEAPPAEPGQEQAPESKATRKKAAARKTATKKPTTKKKTAVKRTTTKKTAAVKKTTTRKKTAGARTKKRPPGKAEE